MLVSTVFSCWLNLSCAKACLAFEEVCSGNLIAFERKIPMDLPVYLNIVQAALACWSFVSWVLASPVQSRTLISSHSSTLLFACLFQVCPKLNGKSAQKVASATLATWGHKFSSTEKYWSHRSTSNFPRWSQSCLLVWFALRSRPTCQGIGPSNYRHMYEMRDFAQMLIS